MAFRLNHLRVKNAAETINNPGIVALMEGDYTYAIRPGENLYPQPANMYSKVADMYSKTANVYSRTVNRVLL
ncbi:hypothetical protein [Bacteroides fluxus]|uniref:hypothetical protein n=1 Tax=Bacteroides fluxus TaxID=626930 RepID=UPI002357FC44|nr:hypothetical protein [Bacteroides fluxus]